MPKRREVQIQPQGLAPAVAQGPAARAQPGAAVTQRPPSTTYVGDAGSGQKGAGASTAPDGLHAVTRVIGPHEVPVARGATASDASQVVECSSRWLQELAAMERGGSDVSEERDALVHGVRVELTRQPPLRRLSNTTTVRRYKAEVQKRLKEYAAKGAVEELSAQPALVHPLHVIVRGDRKPRLVLDLSRNLNEFIDDRWIAVRYEDLREAVRCSKPGMWYGKHDVSDCYLSFPVHVDSRQYLAFGLDGRWYRFVRLPFGLASAPRTCTKLLDVVSHALRAEGVRHVRYLDDFLYLADSPEELAANMALAERVISEFGLVVNAAKTVTATQCIEFLGVEINSVACTLACTPARLTELRGLIASAMQSKWMAARALRSLVGKFSFAAQVLPGARPYMRRLIDQLQSTAARGGLLRVNGAMRADLSFWSDNLSRWNGRCRWIADDPVVTVASDASLSGFGGVVEVDATGAATAGTAWRGAWTGSQKRQVKEPGDVVYAEMFGALYAVHAVAQAHENCAVRLVLDSATSVAVVNAWRTRSRRVAGLLREMAALTSARGLVVTAVHRAGVENYWPDVLSRSVKHRGRALSDLRADRSVIPAARAGDVLRLYDVCSGSMPLRPNNDVRRC